MHGSHNGADVLNALRASPLLSTLAPRIISALATSATITRIAPKGVIYDPFSPPKLAVIQQGRAKVQVIAPDGRAASVRHVGPGDLVGVPSVLRDGAPFGAHALSECHVVYCDMRVVNRLLDSEISFVRLLASLAAETAFEAADLLAGNLFGTVRQRVCKALLDVAVERDGTLHVTVHQDEIANLIGSVREVVARALREIRAEEAIAKSRHGIQILDLEYLRENSKVLGFT